MSPRRRPKSDRESYHHGDARAALVREASALIESQGVAKFSLREAARRVGIDPAGVYRHFRGRREVLVAVAQGGFDQLSEAMAHARAALGASPPGRDVLLAIGQAYVDFAVAAPAVFRLMFGAAGVPARSAQMRAGVTGPSPYEQLVEALRTWAAEAERADADLDALATALWAGVHGTARLVVDGAFELDAAAVVRRLVDALLAP